MNIMFFLLPKKDTGWIYYDFTLRQAMEKMKYYGYTAMPVVDGDGIYKGIITEGDLLKKIREKEIISDKDLEKEYISEISEISTRQAVKCYETMENLMDIIKNQNFVCVIDDRNTYIGIITRKTIIEYLDKKSKNI